MAVIDEEILFIPQGARYLHTFTYMNDTGTAAKDLTGFSAQMQIRASVDDDTILYDSETAGDLLITNAANGEFTLDIPASTTKGWTFLTGVYDIFLDPDGTNLGDDKIKYLKGEVETDPDVTR